MVYHSFLNQLRLEDKLVQMLNAHERGEVTMSEQRKQLVERQLKRVRHDISITITSFGRGI